MLLRSFGAMKGCVGGNAADTGFCVAAWPMKLGDESGPGPSGIGIARAGAGSAASAAVIAMKSPRRTGRALHRADLRWRAIRMKHGRDRDRAVLLLAVLDDRDDPPPHGERGSVQRVQPARTAPARGPVPPVEAAAR